MSAPTTTPYLVQYTVDPTGQMGSVRHLGVPGTDGMDDLSAAFRTNHRRLQDAIYSGVTDTADDARALAAKYGQNITATVTVGITYDPENPARLYDMYHVPMVTYMDPDGNKIDVDNGPDFNSPAQAHRDDHFFAALSGKPTDDPLTASPIKHDFIGGHDTLTSAHGNAVNHTGETPLDVISSLQQTAEEVRNMDFDSLPKPS